MTVGCMFGDCVDRPQMQKKAKTQKYHLELGGLYKNRMYYNIKLLFELSISFDKKQRQGMPVAKPEKEETLIEHPKEKNADTIFGIQLPTKKKEVPLGIGPVEWD